MEQLYSRTKYGIDYNYDFSKQKNIKIGNIIIPKIDSNVFIKIDKDVVNFKVIDVKYNEKNGKLYPEVKLIEEITDNEFLAVKVEGELKVLYTNTYYKLIV